MSDFVRKLVVIRAAGNWLGLESEENLEALRRRAELHQLSERLGKIASAAGHKRPYYHRSAQDTDVVGLILPSGLARLTEFYTDVRRLSKNDLCGILLMEGLMIYMTGEKNLLQVIAPASQLPDRNSVT